MPHKQSNLQCDAKGKQYVFFLLQSAPLFSPPRRVWCSVLLLDNTVKQSFVKRSRRPYLSLERKSSLLYFVLLQYQNKNKNRKKQHPPLCFSLWGCFSSTYLYFFLLVFYIFYKKHNYNFFTLWSKLPEIPRLYSLRYQQDVVQFQRNSMAVWQLQAGVSAPDISVFVSMSALSLCCSSGISFLLQPLESCLCGCIHRAIPE